MGFSSNRWEGCAGAAMAYSGKPFAFWALGPCWGCRRAVEGSGRGMLSELPCASCGCIDGLTGRAGLGGSEAQLVMSEHVICLQIIISVPLEWGQEISILHKLNGSSPRLCKRKR